MVRSKTRQVAFLALFAIASMQTSHVYADDVDVTAQEAVKDVVADTETPATVIVQQDREETVEVEAPVVVEKEAEEPVLIEEKIETPAVVEEKVEEPVPVDIEDDIKDPDVIEEVADASPEDEQEEDVPDLNMDIDAVDMKDEIISKVKDILKSSDLDAKKIAAFGLGAWGTATGIGWAMEKIGGKKDD